MSLKTATGLQVAAATFDTHLGEILLSAGAAVNESEDCLLELAAYASMFADNDEDALDFLRLLVNHGATVDTFTKSCECGPRVSLVFALAISSENDGLARFLIEKGALASMSKRFEIRSCHCRCCYWLATDLEHLEFTYTPLQLAVIIGNGEIVERLLQPIFSRPTQASPESIKKLLLLSCLVGDTATALRLLKLEDIHIDRDMEWPDNATPLILSAWNPDTTIAQALLDFGANAGPKVGSNIRHTSTLCPIHAAALYGNVNLVCLLADWDADLDVHYNWHVANDMYYYLFYGRSCPLEFAFRSQHTKMIQLLYPT
ncbi:ankyrin repeat-containing domain protein [Xylaria sp. FL0064]|nr:ankyrin repeat-containing domain protein [Xylaria sp. FL0064]